MLSVIIKFFLENKLITTIVIGLLIGWGIISAPFGWDLGNLPSDPVAVDAIPDLGENQQIVYTKWPGRSPQNIDDQITYPLSTALMGIPGVRTIRSNSMLGISSIYIIFEDDIDFYWSRSRILEKLNSLPSNTLPEGVSPALGPDATALGQIFWYTLEGRTPDGQPAPGWDPQELRSIQDYLVKYALASVNGVSEVASIGGFVKEYQIDIDPLALQANNVNIMQVMNAVRKSNLDVGAKTVEINRAEYLVRGLGYIKSIQDLETAVIVQRDQVPLRIGDVAKVSLGPAPRRGILDKSGAEAVGGVVVARYGANPMAVIERVKKEIEKISSGLPRKTLEDGSISQVTVVPFYDRSTLIQETLGTLEEALSLEILITIIVIILMVLNLRASLLISSMLPLAVLMCFIAMRQFGVDANIVALSGIAIAIGTIVDMGIVLSENMLRHLADAPTGSSKLEIIFRATKEVASAVITSVATTLVSFLPVFTMEAAEGKLFRPLAFTKTFALLAAIFIAIVVLPAFAHWLFSLRIKRESIRRMTNIVAVGISLVLIFVLPWAGFALLAIALAGLGSLAKEFVSAKWHPRIDLVSILLVAIVVAAWLSSLWLPLGPEKSGFLNFLFVALLIGSLIALFHLLIYYYPRILRWCLAHKIAFLSIPVILLIWGLMSWIGFRGTFGFLPDGVLDSNFGQKMATVFPKTQKEFMPALDEGSFLLMPSSMPHAGVEENAEILALLDMAVTSIPEVEWVVGKAGRVESALDPAPLSMYENIIQYKPEFKTDEKGRMIRFAVDDAGEFTKDEQGNLIPDDKGQYYRNWRPHIHSPDDIWQEIEQVQIPGVTAAPKLQPIETRLLMLQTGTRAPMAVKISGNNLDSIAALGFNLETLLKNVKGMAGEKVVADQVLGKPYIEIDINRAAISRYGLNIADVQHVIEGGIGGMALTYTVEGRERYAVRVRYARELRNDPGQIANVLIPTPGGLQVPLGDLAEIRYEQGPQVIKSEDQFFVSYVLMGKEDAFSATSVIENATAYLDSLQTAGALQIPTGTSYEFIGEYENQVRADARLILVMPIALIFIFLILYLQFRSVPVTLMIFSGIFVAFAGGFIMIWLYGQSWFLDFSLFGENLRDLFNMESLKISTAVWVGFIALFGIATDDGVVMATYLNQSFEEEEPQNIEDIRAAVVTAGERRIRPCLMTTATTLLALLPILTSTGRGSDIMVPMAIPSFGGMMIEIITLFIIPVLFAAWQERKLSRKNATS